MICAPSNKSFRSRWGPHHAFLSLFFGTSRVTDGDSEPGSHSWCKVAVPLQWTNTSEKPLLSATLVWEPFLSPPTLAIETDATPCKDVHINLCPLSLSAADFLSCSDLGRGHSLTHVLHSQAVASGQKFWKAPLSRGKFSQVLILLPHLE